MTPPADTTADADKELATLRARAALAGVAVHVCRDDRGQLEYVASRWIHSKGFGSLDGLKTWLDLIGAPR